MSDTPSATAGRSLAEISGEPRIGIARPFSWPGGAPFALFLSHDIDQIHDRELWRVLADLNHARRVLLGGEKGDVGLALRRVGRALFAPKPAVRDFETILDIEARHGYRSTFFVLHDRYWARYGARFHLVDPALASIASLIRGAKCELGVHGGYYRFNDARAYRESREAVGETFGVEPTGIRNHYLRFSGSETWKAQAEAGYSYDATFGESSTPGPREGRCHPFWAVEPGGGGRGLVELPLSLMEISLFRFAGLSGPAALGAAWSALAPVMEEGGLVTLLWHNNFFNEPEYSDWQWAYEELLARLSALGPWCATGAEIDRWWRALQGFAVEGEGEWFRAVAGEPVEGLALRVEMPGVAGFRSEEGPLSAVRDGSVWRVALPPLRAGQALRIQPVRPS